MESRDAIIFEALSAGNKNQADQKCVEIVDFYRDCSQLIEKTYSVLGKKNVYQVSLQSTTKSKIDARSITTTSKI